MVATIFASGTEVAAMTDPNQYEIVKDLVDDAVRLLVAGAVASTAVGRRRSAG